MDFEFTDSFLKKMPPQTQNTQPGLEKLMDPSPVFDDPGYISSNKLKGKVALITGGDSGIGRSVACAYAKEGADISIVYFNEHDDASETQRIVESIGRKCLLIPGDISDEDFCKIAVQQTINKYKKIDILINNAAVQYVQNSIEDITAAQLEKTFKTNVFGMFYLCKETVPHLKPGSAIINTASITAYKGEKTLIDYSSTKGAVVTFTRSLALSLCSKHIRVNAVAPGPIWTPLIPSSCTAEEVAQFGTTTPIGRPGQPVELAPAYVFLASDDSSYVNGSVIPVNGGSFMSN
ncbi:MAG: short chain dehydrogenase/reductase oxidoreductase [Clostridiaceae bacterium]|jgi:NAD(P)-dependent dehydrogenase (short-subunit alcohol dehydrogenase family)|nr:short chain dehydrogenase/reductase oxidoreductase [Clostridiaceae bacterium]